MPENKNEICAKARQTMALSPVGIFLDAMANYEDLHGEEPVHCLSAVRSYTNQLNECAGLHFKSHESAKRHLQATHGPTKKRPAQHQIPGVILQSSQY